MNLYEITSQFKKLQLLSENDEMDKDLIAEVTLELKQNLQEKSQGYVDFMKNLEAHSNALKDEITRLKARKDKADELHDKLKETLLNALVELNIDTVNTVKYTIKQKNNPESVYIDEFVKLPVEYERTVIKTDPDKIKIKEALKNGIEIDGCKLVRTKGISIK